MIGIATVLATIDKSGIERKPFSLTHCKADGTLGKIASAQKGHVAPEGKGGGTRKFVNVKANRIIVITVLNEKGYPEKTRNIKIATIIKFNGEYVKY